MVCARKRSQCRGQSHNRVSVPVWFGRDSLFLVTARCVQPKPSPVGSAVTWPTNFVGGNVALTGRGLAVAAFTDTTTKRDQLASTTVATESYWRYSTVSFESNDSWSIWKRPSCIMVQLLISLYILKRNHNLVFNSSDCNAKGHKEVTWRQH